MPAKITSLDIDNLVHAYQSGKSIKQLANEYGVDRTTITSRLIEVGTHIRGPQEAILLAYSRIPISERKRIAAKANQARRVTPPTEEELCKKAVTRQASLSKVGSGENILAGWLRSRGLDPIQQYAVGRYNIDLAIHPIAVEIKLDSSSRRVLTTKELERTKYLLNAGWSVIYILVTKTHFLNVGAADYIMLRFQEAQRDPSAIGQYWVIRGSGETISANGSNLD